MRNMKKAALILGCMLLVGGCAKAQSTSVESSAAATAQSEVSTEAGSLESSEAAQGEKTIKDVRGREVTIKLPVKTAYYPYYYENLLTICGEDIFEKITCTSFYDTEHYSKTMWDIMMEKTPGFKDMQDVGSTIKDNFDTEKLISLKPDVAIFANYQYENIGENNIKAIEAAGIPVIFIDYTDLSEEAHYESTRVLGEIFGKEERAKELIDNYKTKMEEIRKVAATIPEEDKKTVYIELRFNTDNFKEYGKTYGNHMMGLLAKEAGAINIYEGIYEKNGDAEPEYLFSKNPYAIFLEGGNFTGENMVSIKTGYTTDEATTQETLNQLISARDGWDQLDAVKEKRVYALDNDIMRTLHDYVLIEYIGKALYPETFKDFDPVKEQKEFVEKYVPQFPADSTFMTQWEGK